MSKTRFINEDKVMKELQVLRWEHTILISDLETIERNLKIAIINIIIAIAFLIMMMAK